MFNKRVFNIYVRDFDSKSSGKYSIPDIFFYVRILAAHNAKDTTNLSPYL